MFNILDMVKHLESEKIGVVVYCYDDDCHYEVEFTRTEIPLLTTGCGFSRVTQVMTLKYDQIEKVDTEILTDIDKRRIMMIYPEWFDGYWDKMKMNSEEIEGHVNKKCYELGRDAIEAGIFVSIIMANKKLQTEYEIESFIENIIDDRPDWFNDMYKELSKKVGGDKE